MAEPVYLLVNSPELHAGCLSVRRAVFIEGMGIAEDLEVANEEGCCHVLAQLPDGTAVGTGRFELHGEVVRMQRVAVLPEWRGQRIGVRLMLELEAAARQAGFRRAELHAQVPVIAFYEGLGYVADGDEFEEAGLPHRLMRKRLK